MSEGTKTRLVKYWQGRGGVELAGDGAPMRVKVMKSQVGTWHGAVGIVGIMWCAAERG